jgi:molybdopterin converting factor small subunit
MDMAGSRIVVRVVLSAGLREYARNCEPDEELRLECPAQATVADMVRHLDIPLEAVKIVMINGRGTKMTARLADDDRVALFPALAGG